LYDSALSHYKEEIDRIKKSMTRATCVELQVRLNFKLGYLMELRTDKEMGLRYYQLAYNDLQNIEPISPNHYREVKGVSDWILLRICLLLTSLSLVESKVNEAIMLFQVHWLKYRVVRHNETPYENWAWQVQQFGMFGQLLEGLNANFYDRKNKLSLPGFYYEVQLKQTAGVYSLQRLKVTRKSDVFMVKAMHGQELMEAFSLRFNEPFYVGQLGALAAHLLQEESFDILPLAEQDAMFLMVMEMQSDPLKEALSYFTKAKKFYSDLGALRHMLAVSAQLADLLTLIGDLPAAEVLLNQTYRRYQADGWTGLEKGKTHPVIVSKLMESARTVGHSTDSLRYLLKVISLDPPAAAAAFESLQSILQTQGIELEVEGEANIAVQSSFSPAHISVCECSTLQVSVLSKFPVKLSHVSIELRFFESQFNRVIADQVALEPGTIQTFVTEVQAQSRQVATVKLQTVVVHYAPSALSSLSFVIPARKTKLEVSIPTPKLTVVLSQTATALLGEEHAVQMTLTP
jgi:tetratricopeptide (TPR) repeat protein